MCMSISTYQKLQGSGREETPSPKPPADHRAATGQSLTTPTCEVNVASTQTSMWACLISYLGKRADSDSICLVDQSKLPSWTSQLMGSDHGGTEGHRVHLHLCVQLNIHLWLPSTQKSKNLLNLSLPPPKATVRSPRLTDYKAIRNLVMSPGKTLLPKKMADRGAIEYSKNGDQKPRTALLLYQ